MRSSRGSKRATSRRSFRPRPTEKRSDACDFALYLVERFFNKIKHYRAIATRFDKLANTFLAGVLLVCLVLWLN